MTWWLWLFAISLVISHLCRQRMNRPAKVSRNTALRYEQDRPFPECFDEMEDDL